MSKRRYRSHTDRGWERVSLAAVPHFYSSLSAMTFDFSCSAPVWGPAQYAGKFIKSRHAESGLQFLGQPSGARLIFQVANKPGAICRIDQHGERHALAGLPTFHEAGGGCYSICIDVEALMEVSDV